MMPRDINDQPGDLPGEGETEVPRAVRYLLDGYGRENVKGWTDDDCPRVVMTLSAWLTAVNTAAECGEAINISIGSGEPGWLMVGARIRVGEDSDEVLVGATVEADGNIKFTVSL